MRQLICRRTCEWLEIGYTYRAVRISYLVRLAEVAHIHTGYCQITTCYRARPDKRAQRVAFSSKNYSKRCSSIGIIQRTVYTYAKLLNMKHMRYSGIIIKNFIHNFFFQTNIFINKRV